MKLQFTIGEISKILNVPKDTLRYYDKIGLFAPNLHGKNNYRYYHLEQFDTLITIKMLRNMDISVTDIKSILSDYSLDSIKTLLHQKKLDLEQELNRINMLNNKLGFLQQELSNFQDHKGIEVVTRPPFWAVLTDSIMESQDKTIDKKISDLFSNIKSELISLSHTVSIVSKDNILNSNYHSYLHNGIISSQKIPGVLFEEATCMRKYIIIEKDCYTELDQHYNEMKQFAVKNNLEIAGNSLEINIYNQYNQHYIVIYIPVLNS